MNATDKLLKDGITLVMPALNEEKNIIPSIHLVQKVFKDLDLEYELILIDDGSVDRTNEICKSFSKKYNQISFFSHHKPKGMGTCYKEALQKSTMKYFMLIVSKNECEENSIKLIVNNRFKADMVIPFTTNQNGRDFFRRNISQLFTFVIRKLTGINLKYFNGTVLHKTNLLKKIDFDANYHTFQSEALIKLIRLNHSYIEVPTLVNWNKTHKTNAFKIKNIYSVGVFIIKIILNRV